ncbi:protein mono-ADP-ribosyltransferase PARP11-like isoform X1 [Polyodon spathula]|uniref:protein mono-ADP-ribosyltransferase PARP11-like isoform X1 n=2 Tax=Polyodon spathula TaxID=7913 RepID=UPI001B7DA456|nr:protein mono-ADP-ribosyltransferase PARP11-like isoform X1 [Polyodon spathula]
MAGFEEVEHMEVAMDTSDTPWCWFYLAECGVWHMFELGSNCQCSVSSEEIERSYRMNERGMAFTTAKYNYMLDFSEMKQINLSTGKQRPIKRAPYCITAFRLISEDQATPVPPYWETVNTEEPYQLICLQEDSNEYKEVARLFKNTMHVCITAIKRIQNLDLWEFFCRKKAQLKRRNQGAEIEEKMLFHGTSHENIEAICTNNFDCRLNGGHGTVFGKGAYFARDAVYAAKFCKTSENHGLILKKHDVAPNVFQAQPHFKSLFLVRVLVGSYTLGKSHYCRPPSKDMSYVNFYDSCVDDINNPKIFVVFDNNQIYPEYLIEFT